MTSCDGCPHESVKRPGDWQPSEVTMAATSIRRAMAAGFVARLEEHDPAVVGAVVRLAALEEHGDPSVKRCDMCPHGAE